MWVGLETVNRSQMGRTRREFNNAEEGLRIPTFRTIVGFSSLLHAAKS